MSTPVDVVVIGAGQAGLSTAYFLRRAGFEPFTGYVVLDADRGAGGAWRHRWPSLRFGSAHRIHPLPGSSLDGVDLAAPASEVISRYYADYESAWQLPVLRPVSVRAVHRDGERLRVLEAGGADWSARGVVNATGTWSKPFWPYYPGRVQFRGRQLHTADYPGPQEFAGHRVVVVGGGNSAVQLLAEISEIAATTWVTRREPVWISGAFNGRDAVARVEQTVALGLPTASVVSVTGLALTPAVQAARDRGALERLPMFDRITADAVVWNSGRVVPADVILWCTGFRPALDHLAPLHLRESGGGIRLVGTSVAREPRVQLVGYGPSASTIGATRAGRTAATNLRRLLSASMAIS